MDYRKMGSTYYLRVDKGEEVVGSVLELCRREGIDACTYSGIGGCSRAELATFDPTRGEFDIDEVTGMLELVSLMGNVTTDESGPHHHTHALFAYKQGPHHLTRGGHLKSTTVLYTAEIEVRPVEGTIGRQPDPETKTSFWSFG